ncbi:MAG TPA: hypothetical protein VFG91_03815 [Woeseiaceae bacterium]|nr:hypothetical protein [Woeseiaceae bacterium]
MKRHLTFAIGTLLAGTLAFADVTFESFETADTNNDGEISKDEFYGLVSDAGIYADWDWDSDGFIDEDEFEEIGLGDDFDDWDLDDDSYLDSDEFYDGYFTYFDEDEDGHWDNLDWDDAGEAGLFDV